MATQYRAIAWHDADLPQAGIGPERMLQLVLREPEATSGGRGAIVATDRPSSQRRALAAARCAWLETPSCPRLATLRPRKRCVVYVKA